MLLDPHGGKRVIRGVPSTPRRRPTVTVVIPAFNYARYLPECLDSVLTQRDVDVDAVVVDDCSTDDTPQVMEALAAADARVSVIRHERNRGHVASVNDGFARIEGEYVVKLDADDLIAPGALARATALLDAHPELGFVYGRPQHFSGPPPRAGESRTRSWSLWSGREWVARRCRHGINVISQPEVVMRASVLRQAGPVREDLPHTSDLHTWLKLASLADVGRINGPAQGYYRVHDASMQRTVNSGVMLDFEGRRAAFDAVFAAPEGALAGAGELHDAVRRNIAAAALARACRAYERGRADAEPVDELAAFAAATWRDAPALREWTALERRRAIGAERASRRPRYVAAAMMRRAAEEAGKRRWLRTGEW